MKGCREFSETSGRVAGCARLHGSPGHSLSDSPAEQTCVQRTLDRQRNQNRPQNASRLERYVRPTATQGDGGVRGGVARGSAKSLFRIRPPGAEIPGSDRKSVSHVGSCFCTRLGNFSVALLSIIQQKGSL